MTRELRILRFAESLSGRKPTKNLYGPRFSPEDLAVFDLDPDFDIKLESKELQEIWDNTIYLCRICNTYIETYLLSRDMVCPECESKDPEEE